MSCLSVHKIVSVEMGDPYSLDVQFSLDPGSTRTVWYRKLTVTDRYGHITEFGMTSNASREELLTEAEKWAEQTIAKAAANL